MSAVKFEQSLYKAFEPAYPGQRPIIVDDALESPDTVTLRYEEEAVRANRGDLRGESPTGLLPMTAYKPQPPQMHTTFTESPYSPYSSQSFSTQQTDNAAAQMNQMAFPANNAATGQYMPTQENVGSSVNVLSCHPGTGSQGTKTMLKVSSQYDLQAMSGTGPFAYVSFGSHRVAAQILRDTHHGGSECVYTISAEAPQFISTNCPSPNNVPLALSVENGNGEEVVRVDSAGIFTYHDTRDAPSTTGSAGTVSPHEGLTRGSTQSPEQRGSPPQSIPVSSTGDSPSSSYHGLQPDPTTNGFGFPSAVAPEVQAHAHIQAQAQPNFAAGGYTQGTNNMLGTYRTSSFADQYARAPPPLRSSHGAGWNPYGSEIGTVRSPATTIGHTAITRPSLTSLPRPASGAPQLVRTSTLSSPPGAGLVGGGGYNPYAMFPSKATLKINGDLESMAENWTQEEWDNRRRIVLFKKSQHGSQLQTTFRPVAVNERPPNSTCISCIWWAEKQECYVTSVDTIYLLEQLVAAPARFTVEEKNRIRRNLEGFHPLTVSKTKADSAEFFKVIMSFGNPKPRNIEKDVKVFPWKILSQALKKIISKYSASPSATTMAPPTAGNLLNSLSANSSYPSLPPTTGQGMGPNDPAAATGYMTSAHQPSDSLPSPRALPSSWAPYSGAPNRPLSPGLKTHPPAHLSGLRVSSLPTGYDGRASNPGGPSPYGLPSSSHHGQPNAQGYGHPMPVPQQSHHGRSWDPYAVTGGYPSHTGHPAHGQVYGGGAFGDGIQRV